MLDNEPNDTTDAPAAVGTLTDPTTTDTSGPTAGPAVDAPDAAPKKAPRRRATKAAAAPVPSEDVPEADQPAPADEDKPRKAAKKAPAKKAAPRKKAAPKASGTAQQPEAGVPDDLADEPVDLTADDADGATGAAAFTAPSPEEPGTARRRSRAPAVVVTFQAPEETAAPARPRKAAATADEVAAPRPRRRAGTAGAASAAALLAATDDLEATESDDTDDTDDSEDGTGTGAGARRRRRGRRGRGRRPDGEAGSEDESTEDAEGADGDEDEDEEGSEGTGAAGTRRRRRRRRTGGGAAGADGDDDVPTVVHVREPGQGGGGQQRQRTRNRDGGGAADEDGVRGISGSTRMAAKRVRRQEGRDSGRNRAQILTEAEFLARREAVDRQMVVRQKGDRTQIAVLEDGILVEHYVTKASATSYAGNVYLGRVQNVLPSMEAAFVDIGKGRNAVLYAGEVNWDGMSSGSRKIEQALKSGQEVLVQVSKDPIGHKGARLTSQISLPGRYLVYVPESSMTGISRKLPENERTRLKNILKNVVPEGAGVIIRTAAEGASEEEIGKDVRRLQAQWEVIKAKGAGGAPKLLHAEPDLVIKVVRDVFNEDFSKLVVQGESEWETIREYVEFVAPDLAPRLSRFAGNGDVFAEHRIDEQLLKALDRKVYLPSGGSLVIDRTEAMVVVDVNTGKYVGKGGNLEETVTRNNLEAAEEIARQLRLRDLGGIIVVDFIDMVLESNRDLVVRRLVECLGRDRTKHQVAEVTSLGLVQMTRKRVGQGLLESFSETCEHCNGRGVKIHMDPVEPRAERERDRSPKVGSRAPKPGAQAPEPATPGSEDDAPAGEGTGGSRNRRRRGGRGGGAATVQPESELAELLGDAVPIEDVVEQEIVLEPDVLPEIADQPDPSLEDLPDLDEPDFVADTPALADGSAEGSAVPVKKRRRAASRPAGSPLD